MNAARIKRGLNSATNTAFRTVKKIVLVVLAAGVAGVGIGTLVTVLIVK